MSESDQVADFPRDSGATGGAATGSGVDFQVNLAVDRTLDFVSQLLTERPTQRPMIVIEPRQITTTAVTRWDFTTVPDNVLYEGKLNPSRGDVEDWIDRVKMGMRQLPFLTFELDVGELSNGYVRTLPKLLRLIAEESDDPIRFGQLCAVERDESFNQLLVRIGPDAFGFAKRIRLRIVPEDILAQQIRLKLRFLVNAGQAETVRDFLTALFLRAMKKREVFFVPTLIQNLEAKGVVFHKPESVLPVNLHDTTHQAVFLLQRCRSGLPAEIIKNVCAAGDESRLQQMLHEVPDGLTELNGIWRCNPLPAQLTHPAASAILGAALEAVISYIRANRESGLGLEQIANAMLLAEACRSENPAATIRLFGPLDKLLKRLGNKREVLRAAELTVSAAGAVVNRDRAVVEAEAKAKICGHAWVYQRTGQLEKADYFARESLKLGQSIQWTRNTAYCQKCMGRLRRVEAERVSNPRRKTSLLNDSVSLLTQAVATFSGCDEFGPEHEEVGDCYSLLGRTYLSLNRLREAEEFAVKARTLIIDHDSKDYMDLLILEGELAAAKLDYAGADAKLAEALDLLTPADAEKSEIAARAYLCRGVNLKKWKSDVAGATQMVRRAVMIWQKLEEHYRQGVAEWAVLEIKGELPAAVRAKLRDLDPPVAVEAVRLWKEKTAKQNTSTVAQRSQLTDDGWRRVIAHAKENDAIRNRRNW